MTYSRKLLTQILALVLLVGSGLTTALAAPNASLTLSPDKDPSVVGDTVKVTINAAITEFTAGSIEMTLTYDASKLEYVSQDDSGTAFPNSYALNTSSGSIFLGRATNSSGATGSVKVTAFNFKTKATGSTSINFSNPQVYELGTGAAKPISGTNRTLTINAPDAPTPPSVSSFTISPSTITRGGSATLNWQTANASSVSIDQGIGTVAASGSRSVNPTATTKYIITAQGAGGTATKDVTLVVNAPAATPTPRPTSTARTTPRPTAAVTATPTAAPTTTGAISAQLSTVVFSDITALADGVDTITATVTMRRDDGTIVTDTEPEIEGLRELGDSASPFVLDSLTQSWSSQIVSTEPGQVEVTVLGGDVVLAEQTLTFTEAGATEPPITEEGGDSSFGRILLIGAIVLLLLLLLLFFLWRKLREHNDDDFDEGNPDEPAFPGDEGPKGGLAVASEHEKKEEHEPKHEPAPQPEPEKPDEVASFSAANALQRANQPEEQEEDTIPLQ